MVPLINQFVPSLKKRIRSDRDALLASGGRALWLGSCPTADRVISGNWELSIIWGGKNVSVKGKTLPNIFITQRGVRQGLEGSTGSP